MENLVQITEEKFDVILDLRYASKNNVCGEKMYVYPFCYIHKAAVPLLQQAVSSAKHLGLKIKILDSYRPLAVQKFFFDKFAHDKTKEGFISNPNGGVTSHCRGVAIDITLTDVDGNELDMGTEFDDFSAAAFHNCSMIPVQGLRNRMILLGIMSAAGFDFYSKEWWHYQLFKPREYPIIEPAAGMVAI